MPGVRTFASDLAVGNQVEREVATLLGTTVEGMHRDVGDLPAMTAVGKIACEVKADLRFAQTGNIAVELMDVFETFTHGTGITKNVHLGVPTVCVHRLGGDGGDFLVYDPHTTLDYIETLGRKSFDRFVAVPNTNKQNGTKYTTLNGLIKPRRFTPATRVPATELRSYLAQWEPTLTTARSATDIQQVVLAALGAYARNVVHPYTLKGGPAHHLEHRDRILAAAELLRHVRTTEFSIV